MTKTTHAAALAAVLAFPLQGSAQALLLREQVVFAPGSVGCPATTSVFAEQMAVDLKQANPSADGRLDYGCILIGDGVKGKFVSENEEGTLDNVWLPGQDTLYWVEDVNVYPAHPTADE